MHGVADPRVTQSVLPGKFRAGLAEFQLGLDVLSIVPRTESIGVLLFLVRYDAERAGKDFAIVLVKTRSLDYQHEVA